MTSSLRKGDGFGNVTYMAQHAFLIEQEPLVVHTRPVIDMDEEQFFQFCQLNRDLLIERTAEGDIIIRAPEGGSSGRGSSTLNAKFEQSSALLFGLLVFFCGNSISEFRLNSAGFEFVEDPSPVRSQKYDFF